MRVGGSKYLSLGHKRVNLRAISQNLIPVLAYSVHCTFTWYQTFFQVLVVYSLGVMVTMDS